MEVNVTAGPFKPWKYYLKGSVVVVEVNATGGQHKLQAHF
jgi:hypothetical protein